MQSRPVRIALGAKLPRRSQLAVENPIPISFGLHGRHTRTPSTKACSRSLIGSSARALGRNLRGVGPRRFHLVLEQSRPLTRTHKAVASAFERPATRRA